MKHAPGKPHNVECLQTEVLSDEHFPLQRLEIRYETFQGGMSQPQSREVLRSGRSIAVLLYDPEADTFVMVEQFRLGAYLNQLPSPWLLECVAGMVEDGESPEVSARREAEEETGCKVGAMERIGQFLTSPGITDELATVFLGRVRAPASGETHGKASEGEDIRVRVLRRAEAMDLLYNDGLLNVVAHLALQWFALHGEELRARWSGSSE